MDQLRSLPAAGRYRFAALLLCAFFIIGIIFETGGEANAQSGRRVPKRTEPLKPVPMNEPPEQPAETVQPEPSREPVKPQFTLLFAQDTRGVSSSSYTNISNYILANCVERLKEASVFEISVGKDMNRKEASDRAKTSVDAYVVWIQLEGGDNFSGGGGGRLSDFSVNYVIFSPGTAKIKNQGRVYLGNYRSQQQQPTVGIGGVAVPVPVPLPPGTTLPGSNPGPVRTPLEHTLQQAGRDTADRIISAFDVIPPRNRRF